MFSGIVEEMGAASVLNKGLAGTRLTIIASTIMSDLTIGASVSVNGTCPVSYTHLASCASVRRTCADGQRDR